MEFVELEPAAVRWDTLDAFPDRVFSQRRAWLEFVAEVAGGRIVIAALRDAGVIRGYFSGILFRRLGLQILGSPFKGWTTTYMGFNLSEDVSRIEALQALKRFAFEKLGCVHLEILDRHLTMADIATLDVDVTVEPTFVTPLEQSEEEIFAGMKSACRRCIRKAERNGLVIEEASPEGFAAEYYEQLVDVFAKQKLTPPYTSEYVQTLIDKVHPTGDALLLRAMTQDGERIASAIYFGHRDHSLFWGNGSFREHQILRPNEALHWYALKYWKGRGVKFHDWCGPNQYKLKFGPQPLEVPRIRMSRHRAIKWGRDAALHLYTLPRTIRRNRFTAKLDQYKAVANANHDTDERQHAS